MAERLGMADGRCTTIHESTRLFNDKVYMKGDIDTFDNFGYRQFLQKSSPEDIVPPTNCSLFSYKEDFKGFDVLENTNVMSQIVDREEDDDEKKNSN